MHLVKGVAMAAGLTVTVLAISAASSVASASTRREIIKDYKTGRCLDSNTHGSAYTQPCNGGSYQKWYQVNTSNGFILKNAKTGRCLDSNTHGSLYTQPCNGGSYQVWVSASFAATYSTVWDNKTGRYLDSNTHGNAYTQPYNGGGYQRWRAFAS